jgi:hypothetical protein
MTETEDFDDGDEDDDYVYDKASWHERDEYNEALVGRVQFAVGGPMLGWLATRGLLDPEFSDACSDIADGGVSSGIRIYEIFDGAFLADQVLPEVHPFLEEYFLGDRKYVADLGTLKAKGESVWRFDWTVPSRARALERLIDSRYDSWRKSQV